MKKWIPAIALLCSSCSVTMAANQGGTSLESIMYLSTREELLAEDATLVSTETTAEGKEIATYTFPKKHGSLARATLHGLLDLWTAFLWELIATPYEASQQAPGNYTVQITLEGDQIQHIQLQ